MMVAMLGALLLATGASLGGYQTWSWSKTYDWNKVKPVWLLHRQARNSTAASGVAVLDELIDRLDTNRLTAAAAKPIIESAIARQADITTPWNQQWGNFVSGASKRNFISDDQEKRYLAGVVVLIAEVRPWVYPGEPVPVSFVIAEPRCGASEKFQTQIMIKHAQIGDKELNYKRLGGGLGTYVTGSRWPDGTWGLLGGGSRGVGSINRYLSDPAETLYTSQVTAPDDLGPAQISLTWHIVIERDDESDSTLNSRIPARDIEGLVTSERRYVLDFEIVEPGTHPITTRPGNDEIKITTDRPRLERFRKGFAAARGRLLFEGVNASAGYDLIWILPADVAEAWHTDREWIVGSYIFNDDGQTGVSTFGYSTNNITFPEAQLDQGWLEGVQIVLRPSARISRMTVDIMEMPAQPTDLGTHRVQVIDNRRR